MNLLDLGWNDFFQAQYAEFDKSELLPGRIALQQKKTTKILTPDKVWNGQIAGRLYHTAESQADFPVIGDWVLFKPTPDDAAVIHQVLLRQTKISRDTGTRRGNRMGTEEQIIAANIDTVFLISAADDDFNPRRIERYLTLVWDGGAEPVIVLNKIDVCDDFVEKISELEDIAMGTPIVPLSAKEKSGIEALEPFLVPRKTIALLGSSGVGKSTLINAILGEERLAVGEIGDYKDKGRHTTTHRELIMLQNGTLLIDNPGMRAVQIWDGEEGLARSFEAIEKFAENCRFNDCRHGQEPGCAVKAAVESGDLSKELYDNFLKLQKEADYQARRYDKKEGANTKKRWKQISKEIKRHYKNK